MSTTSPALVASVALLSLVLAGDARPQQSEMTFFVTSVGSGKGADLGGLEGAETGLTEKGAKVNGRGDTPNMHDILTGSQPDGTASPGDPDRTCGNWTKGGSEGAAMVGHHDRIGLRDDEPSRSWNSSHPSRNGCSLEALKGTGGAGLLYCFAVK